MSFPVRPSGDLVSVGQGASYVIVYVPDPL